jgi:hypothetical protein
VSSAERLRSSDERSRFGLGLAVKTRGRHGSLKKILQRRDLLPPLPELRAHSRDRFPSQRLIFLSGVGPELDSNDFYSHAFSRS